LVKRYILGFWIENKIW